MPYYDVANLVLIVKHKRLNETNINRRNGLWLWDSRNHQENTGTKFRVLWETCAEVRNLTIL